MKEIDFEKISVHEGPKQSPGFLLWQISTAWRRSIETVLKPYDLTHPQFVILATTGWLTKKGGPATQITVGKMAGLDPNTTSQIIKGLEKKELIKRAPSLDGRAKNVSLTKEGSTLLLKALPAVEKADSKFFDPLTQKELESWIRLTQTL